MSEIPMSETPTREVPVDGEARHRLRDEHDLTIFVEAGAGTGKTTALVSRVVALVAGGKLTMPRLVAITFTEAAAAELQDRVRRELEVAAAASSHLDESARALCRNAAREVDLAAISTIHAFAAALLRTYPLAAGLPPGFEVLDPIQQDLQFDERFRAWLYDEVPSSAPAYRARRDAVRHALALGMTVTDVRDLVRAFQAHTDVIGPALTWPVEEPPDPVSRARDWGRRLLDLRRLIRLAKRGLADPLVNEIQKLEPVAARLAEVSDPDEALRALCEIAKPKLSVGNKSNFQVDDDGTNPVPFIKDTLSEAWSEVEATVAAHRDAAFAGVLLAARDFTVAYARERRAHGVATFHDLLTRARDLLRHNVDVRTLAGRRFDRVFVDEFQDTDPLQAEIVWFLAEDPCSPPAKDWSEVVLQPGKLFLVGDPKQSIYRFRRADIGVYAQVTSRAQDDERSLLVQNFRSLPPVLEWINAYFGRYLRDEPGVQARYVDLVPARTSVADEALQGGVYLVGGPIPEKIDEVRRQEADTVARLIGQAVSDGRWLIRGTNGLAPARYADFCVLFPKRANLSHLEDALESRGVPYRIEGGSLVLNTPEVRDLLACLRAIDDPSDQVALVAALRSGAYACSDVDLLDWVEDGRALAYDAVPASATGPVADALRSLSRFHAARVDRSAAATIEVFVRERALALAALASPRPREAWRRLRYVLRQARLFASSGRPGLRALLDWLDVQRVANLREPESPLPEADEDAVRLLTIHGAKGLEFPCVILTGLGNDDEDREPRVKVLVDREPEEAGAADQDGVARLEVRCGPFQTAGYASRAPRDQRRDEAEKVRLFYVAATRARDHLILCLHHKEPKVGDGKAGAKPPSHHAARVLEAFHAGGHSLAQVLEIDDRAPIASFGSAPDPDLTPDQHRQAEERWRAERADLIRRSLARPELQLDSSGFAPPESAPFAADLQAKFSSATEPPDLARGTVIRALARGLEQAARNPSLSADEAAREGAGELLLDPRSSVLAGWIGALLAEPGVREALREGRFWSQLPIGVALDGVVVQGSIDLVYERPDGRLAVLFTELDSRNDVVVAPPASSLRVRQGAAILALETISRRSVGRAATLGANGRIQPFAGLANLKMEARHSLRRHRGTGLNLVIEGDGSQRDPSPSITRFNPVPR